MGDALLKGSRYDSCRLHSDYKSTEDCDTPLHYDSTNNFQDEETQETAISPSSEQNNTLRLTKLEELRKEIEELKNFELSQKIEQLEEQKNQQERLNSSLIEENNTLIEKLELG